MSIISKNSHYGPRTITNGLVLCLDAGNSKGFDDDENLLTNTTSAAAWASGTFTTETTYPILGLNTVRITDLSSDGDAANLNGGAISPGTYTVSHYIDTINSTSTSVLLYIFTFHALNDGFTLSNANATFTLSTKTFSSISYSGPAWSNASVSAVNIGNGIYRISITTTTSLAGTGIRAYLTPLPLDTSYLIVAGSQYETGSVANTYYPTSGTAKNRGTVWTDLSGNGNNGTLVNGVSYNSANGGSLVFDGSNDYGSIQHSSTLSFATALTLSVWFYSNTNPTNILYLKGRTDVDNYNPLLFADGEYAWTGPNGRSRYLPSAGYTVSNTWYNLTVSHTSGSNPVIYRNAVASTSHTYIEGNGTYALGTNSDPVGINADIPRGTIEAFNGRIALLQVYNRALTATEIRQNYLATKSRYGL